MKTRTELPTGVVPDAKRPAPPFPEQPLTPPGIEADMEPRAQYRGRGYRPSGKLMGRVALITGGDSGIGRSVAVLFAREGADVAIVHLPEEERDASETCDEIQSFGRRALSIPGDVSDPAFCREAVRRCVETFGNLDILVNNAAVQKHRETPEELDIEEWHRTFRTNIHSYFYMTRAALVHLGEGASILNTGSITGLEGSARLLDYSATKGAIHAFTKSLSKALVERGIRVNCVAPGPVWTPLNPAERDPEDLRDFGSNTPMGRPAQPEEVAPAYVFLASNADASYITGQVITPLGGKTRAG